MADDPLFPLFPVADVNAADHDEGSNQVQNLDLMLSGVPTDHQEIDITTEIEPTRVCFLLSTTPIVSITLSWHFLSLRRTKLT